MLCLKMRYGNLIFMALILCASLGLVACSRAQSAAGESNWSTQLLADKLTSGEVFRLIDVREPEEYQAGHIPGAELMPLGQLTQYLDQLHPNEVIAVICRSGNRSQQAVRLLRQHGYTNVHNVTGGMLAWRGAVKVGLEQ